MRRFIKGSFFLILLSISLLIGVRTTLAQASASRLSPAEAKQVIAARALEVMRALKRGDMQRLSTFVHPQKGVRLSPYVYINGEDRVFTRRAVGRFSIDRRRYDWGSMDESDERIRLTPKRFFKEWIYDRDFLNAREVNYNTQTQRGNTIPNVTEYYPRAITVEYFFPSTDAKMYAGLYLVFEQLGNQWYLVGIVRDSWTI